MAKTTRVVMPQLGESVHEGTIAKWLVKPGDKVVEFEPMLEGDTDKVSAEVPSPVSGILREILAQEGQTVQAGAEIAVVEVGADGEVAASPEIPSPQRGEGQGEGREQPKPTTAKAAPAPQAVPATAPASQPRAPAHPRQHERQPNVASRSRRGKTGDQPRAVPAYGPSRWLGSGWMTFCSRLWS